MPTTRRPHARSVARGEGHAELFMAMSGAARGDDASVGVSGSGRSCIHPRRIAASPETACYMEWEGRGRLEKLCGIDYACHCCNRRICSVIALPSCRARGIIVLRYC